MFYQRKPMTVRAYKYTGKYVEDKWPEFLPKPILVQENRAIFNRRKNELVLYSEIFGNDPALYLMVDDANPTIVYKWYYIVLYRDGNIKTIAYDIFEYMFEPEEVK